MKTSIRHFTFVLLLTLVIILASCNRQSESTVTAAPPTPKHLIIATDATFPPMEFTDDSGKIIGFDVDLMSSVTKEAGLDAEFKNVAWDGIFGALNAGNADMIVASVTITDERKTKYDFSTPYMRAGQVILVRTDDKAKFPDIASLKGHKVGVIISTTGAVRMQKEPVELKQYSSGGLAVIDLINGNTDAVMIDKPVAEYYAARKAEFAKKVVVAGQPYTEEQFGIVVRKGDTELLAKLNRALDKLSHDGTLAQLEGKWFR